MISPAGTVEYTFLVPIPRPSLTGPALSGIFYPLTSDGPLSAVPAGLRETEMSPANRSRGNFQENPPTFLTIPDKKFRFTACR